MGRWIYIEDEKDEPEDDGYNQSAEDYWEDEQERREEELMELAATCKCGAWQYNQFTHKVTHVADCCCGAE